MSTETRPSEGSIAANAELGQIVEDYAGEHGPVALVESELAADWYDGVLTLEAGSELAGTPLEAKGCRLEIGHEARRGRFWINRDCHERLLEAGGIYLFGVYDDAGTLQAVAIRTAELVDRELADRWTTAGDRHQADECAQVCFTDVMETRR